MPNPLRIELIVDDKGTGVMRQFGRTAERSGKQGQRAFDQMDTKARSLQRTFRGLATAAAGVFALRKLKAAASEWIRLAGKQQQSMAGMEQAMRSMGRYSPQLYNKLINVAQGLQGITTFGDEATIEGQKFLLTYRNISDQMLPRASRAMLDLAALMGGDVRQAANTLGKASMGLGGELRRVGITIDEDVAKSGDFAAILSEIEKQVGGQAQALASTGYGGIEQLGNLYGDLKEDLGGLITLIIQELLPALKKLMNAARDAVQGLTLLWRHDNRAQFEKNIGSLEMQIRANQEALDKMTDDPGLLDKILYFGNTKEELQSKLTDLRAELETNKKSYAKYLEEMDQMVTGKRGPGAGGGGPGAAVIPIGGKTTAKTQANPYEAWGASDLEMFQAQEDLYDRILLDRFEKEEEARERSLNKLKQWGNRSESVAKDTSSNMAGYFESDMGGAARSMADSFSNLLFDRLERRTSSFGDFFKNAMMEIARKAASSMSRIISEKLFGSNGGGGSSGGTFSSMFSSSGGGGSSLFGGGTSSSGGSSGMGMLSSLKGMFGGGSAAGGGGSATVASAGAGAGAGAGGGSAAAGAGLMGAGAPSIYSGLGSIGAGGGAAGGGSAAASGGSAAAGAGGMAAAAGPLAGAAVMAAWLTYARSGRKPLDWSKYPSNYESYMHLYGMSEKDAKQAAMNYIASQNPIAAGMTWAQWSSYAEGELKKKAEAVGIDWEANKASTAARAGGSMIWDTYHRGGVVGLSNVKSRFVDPSMFKNVVRLHDGLKPDEFPAILQKGEEVLPKDTRGRSGPQVVMYVQTPDVGSFKASQGQLMTRAAVALRQARRNM